HQTGHATGPRTVDHSRHPVGCRRLRRPALLARPPLEQARQTSHLAAPRLDPPDPMGRRLHHRRPTTHPRRHRNHGRKRVGTRPPLRPGHQTHRNRNQHLRRNRPIPHQNQPAPLRRHQHHHERSPGPARRIRRNLQRVGPRRPRIRPPPRSRLRSPTPHSRPHVHPPPPQKRPRRPLLGSPPRKPPTPRGENPMNRSTRPGAVTG